MSENDLNKILYDTEYEIYTVETKDNLDERKARLRQMDGFYEKGHKLFFEIFFFIR